jgi:release factor glutamine methyltransferase
LPEATAATTLAGALAEATARLSFAGCDAPRLDAELLLGFVLGVPRARLVIDASAGLAGDALQRFETLVGRREAREPVAYITAVKEFRRISLRVDRRALIPRPETELLVEVGLGLERGARVLDVGTGSGAVALALKDERPDLSLTGTELSEPALELARENAARLGLEVEFVHGDLLGGLHCEAVLANLPYVPEDGAALPPELAFEPALALFAGGDGLDVIRRLVASAGGVPLLALEVGFDQAAAVSALLLGAGFAQIERLRDLAGHERVVLGRR